MWVCCPPVIEMFLAWIVEVKMPNWLFENGRKIQMRKTKVKQNNDGINIGRFLIYKKNCLNKIL